MSDKAEEPLKLPIEGADLPALDASVAEAICLEHHHSILQFAMALVGFGWTPEQIGHVAASWPWLWLAAAVGWERQKAGKELVPPSFLAALVAQKAEHPEGIKVPTQPPPQRADSTYKSV